MTPNEPTKGAAWALRSVLGLVGAAVLAYAGMRMQSIQSVAGNTVAESFYQSMGLVAYGLAAVAAAWSLPRS